MINRGSFKALTRLAPARAWYIINCNIADAAGNVIMSGAVAPKMFEL